MQGTFTLPSGVKFRTASQRRYVIVTASGVILRRTDSKATAYKLWTGSGFVVDTVTREIVYPSSL